jgi:hypothetical protein
LFFCCSSQRLFSTETATIVVPASTATNNYVLYPTTNMYTFLKLDTRNGKIWQVQYSLDNNEFECILNDTELTHYGKPGQFALYPTTNHWTFILLDTINGDTYHVQWSQDKDKRGIYRIRLSLYNLSFASSTC